MGIKLADTLEPMADFPSAYAKDIAFNDGDTLQEKLDTGSLGGGGVGYKQLSQAEYDALTEEEKMDGREYRTFDTGRIFKLGVEYGKDCVDDTEISDKTTWSSEKIASELGSKTYTSLAELGLTADATFQDVIDALPKGGSALLGVTEFTNYQTIFPYEEGNDQFARVHIVKGTADGSRMYARWFRKDGVKEAIAIFNINDNKFGGWRMLKNSRMYTSLTELGLDTTATINDIISSMKDGSVFTYKTDVFDYATEYNNIQYGTVTIHRQHASRVQVIMTDKDTGNLYVGKMDNTNKVIGWRKESFHRTVAQAKAGYFKFKPTSTGIDQPLRISVTDNYGGMINISGATPSSSQYKPFKCIRLSYGEYSNYDAMKLANNKMLNLFYYDGYFYLKVSTYTTCTFTGLIEAPTFIETFDETVADEIPIRSVFDTPYNDGYADPSIIAIGEVGSGDGVIKTLNDLGFTTDVMTWDTGVYRISHVSGLTNLPTEITEEKPGLRVEHYDMKKWGSNHNPYASTYGCRQSVLHYKGNIFVRYTESGATAGVLITDTGWRKIIAENTSSDPYSCSGYKVLTGTEDLFTLPCGHYASAKVNTAYNYPVTDSTNVLAHIYVLGCLNDPANNKGYRIILYFDNKNRMYRINEWWGSFSNGWQNMKDTYTTLAELGLTAPCTTAQIANALKGIKPQNNVAIAIIDCIPGRVSDVPSDYGLLRIETIGYDRISVRFEGIGSSTYAGSWIGKIKGSSGTFSEVTWERTDNKYSTGEVVIGEWIDGKPIYRKVLEVSSIDAKTTSTTVQLGESPTSGQNMLKIEGFLNLIGNQCFIHYPNIADNNEYINATLNIANGYFKLTGTWKYPISKGVIIMEYLKS